MDPKQWQHCPVKVPAVTSVEPLFELSLKLCDEKLSYKQSLLSATGTAFLNYSAGLFLCFSILKSINLTQSALEFSLLDQIMTN